MISEHEFANKRYAPRTVSHCAVGDTTRIELVAGLARPGRRILDVGCYDGSVTAGLLSGSGTTILGIDASIAALRVARERGLIAVAGAVNDVIPFQDRAFDVVVAGEIIEHLVDTDFFLREVWRVLDVPGILVLSTPNVCSLGRRLLMCLGKNAYFEASFSVPKHASGHLRFLTRDLVNELLHANGFRPKWWGSDVVNFVGSGELASQRLAQLVPGLGRSIIVRAEKVEATAVASG